jgi:hypothetical protein
MTLGSWLNTFFRVHAGWGLEVERREETVVRDTGVAGREGPARGYKSPPPCGVAAGA